MEYKEIILQLMQIICRSWKTHDDDRTYYIDYVERNR